MVSALQQAKLGLALVMLDLALPNPYEAVEAAAAKLHSQRSQDCNRATRLPATRERHGSSRDRSRLVLCVRRHLRIWVCRIAEGFNCEPMEAKG